MSESRITPTAAGVDAAMELVCTVPERGRHKRRTDVASAIQRATAVAEIAAGVELTFEGSTDMAGLVFELTLAERQCCAQFRYTILFAPHAASLTLRVEAEGALVQPLKNLYLGLAAELRRV
jgi:hypothetical protein